MLAVFDTDEEAGCVVDFFRKSRIAVGHGIMVDGVEIFVCVFNLCYCVVSSYFGFRRFWLLQVTSWDG